MLAKMKKRAIQSITSDKIQFIQENVIRINIIILLHDQLENQKHSNVRDILYTNLNLINRYM